MVRMPALGRLFIQIFQLAFLIFIERNCGLVWVWFLRRPFFVFITKFLGFCCSIGVIVRCINVVWCLAMRFSVLLEQ